MGLRGQIFLIIIMLFTGASPARAESPEHIQYFVKWTLHPDGRFIKDYRVTYEGPETVKRLHAYGSAARGDRNYVENLLPQRDPSDQPIEAPKDQDSSRGKIFHWRFQRHIDPKELPKKSLTLWLPYWSDPVANPTEPQDHSRIHYELNPLKVDQRFEFRGPQEWVILTPQRPHDLESRGHEGFIRNEELPPDDSGLAGFAMESQVKTGHRDLDPEDKVKIEEAFSRWILYKLEGTMALEKSLAMDPPKAHLGFSHGPLLGSLGVSIKKIAGENHWGLDLLRVGWHLDYGFTRTLHWRFLSSEFRYSLGGKTDPITDRYTGTHQLSWIFASPLEWRFLVPTSRDKKGNQSYFGFFAGPEARQDYFSWAGRGSSTGFSAGYQLGFRWGSLTAHNPLWGGPSGTALVFQYSKMLHAQPVESLFTVSLEAF